METKQYVFTEDEFNEVCKSIVKETLAYEKGVSRHTFVVDVYCVLAEFAEYWCLLRYCYLKGNNEESLQRFRSELTSIMYHILFTKIKHGNKEDERVKGLEKAWDDIEFDNKKMVDTLVRPVFQLERITGFSKDELYEKVKNEFMSSKDEIIKILSKNDSSEVRKYILSLTTVR